MKTWAVPWTPKEWADVVAVNADCLRLLVARMRDGRMSPAQAAELLREIAEVLMDTANDLEPQPDKKN